MTRTTSSKTQSALRPPTQSCGAKLSWSHDRGFKGHGGNYQVHGLDISNVTLVEGEKGVIVIDPLISEECDRAAFNLDREHRGDGLVTGIIYTHSHGDHFGGVRGVMPTIDKTIPIIAPEGVLEHAIAESVYAGNAMTWRAMYMYGGQLLKGPDGQIGAGLGMCASTGTSTLVPPTLTITQTGQEEVVDGVRSVFQLTPGTEAPAEMTFHFPAHRALCVAENATHSMHNVLTLWGPWSGTRGQGPDILDEAIVLFGCESEVAFALHHWSTWGQTTLIRYLSEQRDLYAYLHDQTIRMMNSELTGIEIAEEFTPPPTLQKSWHAQGYYSSVSHNVKAIYQCYMGWSDGNPAQLWEWPPKQAAERYVSCIGDVTSVIHKAQRYADDGDLRLAATLLSHAVFADASSSSNGRANKALASVFNQFGRGAENGTWRNFYRNGAKELRGSASLASFSFESHDALRGLTVDQLLDLLAVRSTGPVPGMSRSLPISL
ncbi:MAG: hypothetical protein M1838_004501 [Thelocarpon superellum]|nr:MAG: hypothetical protein M1838_004501 [Thelocarpon superellum]